MQYNRLGRTGLQVSAACIGTMTFGGQVDLQTAGQCVNLALDQGVNFFDTADVYYDGQAEIMLGKALGARRKEAIVASKVGLGSLSKDAPNGIGLSPGRIRRHVEDSLARLGTDYLDILFLHKPDPLTPIEETLYALDCLVRSGKILHIGLSNFAAWQMCQAAYESEKAHFARPALAEMVYNLLTRDLEQEVIPCLQALDMGLIIFNPLAGGILTGKHLPQSAAKNSRFSRQEFAGYRSRYWDEENFSALEQVRVLASQAGIEPTELALRWCVSQSAVSSVILGFSSPGQLQQNLHALEQGPLDSTTLAGCQQIWRQLKGNRFAYNR